MLVIIAHHYIVHSGILDSISQQQVWSHKEYFLIIFGSGGKMSINCFLLITGYFMCKQPSIKVNKFIKLVGEVLFYRITLYCILIFTGYINFNMIDLLNVVYLFSFIDKCFINCFLLFYLLTPFLNKLICALNKKEHLLLLLWGLFVYTIPPSLYIQNVEFNYITWFCSVYLIGAYVRLYLNDNKFLSNTKITGLLIMVLSILSWASIALIGFYNHKNGTDFPLYHFVSDSNKFLPLATAFFAFLFFLNLKIKTNKIINAVAKTTFGVLLLHDNYYPISDPVRKFLWYDVFKVTETYNSNNVNIIIYSLCCVITVYIMCVIIDIIRIELAYACKKIILKLKPNLEV